MNKVTDRPMVGVGVFCIKDGKFLLGRRKGSHGAGELALPGGHIEHGESILAAAARELFEETGISVGNVVGDRHVVGGQIVCAGEEFFAPVSGDRLNKGTPGKPHYHYVTVYVSVYCPDGTEPVLKEPAKCEEWLWFDIGKVRDNHDVVAHNYSLWSALLRLRAIIQVTDFVQPSTF